MSVTVTAKKTVGFRSPYTGKTFQELTERIFGRQGYLSGGATSDNGSTITVEPARVVSRGIVAESLETATGISVPIVAEPWFLTAAVPDDDPDSGITFSVTTDLVSAGNGIIVAFKTGGVWQNPLPLSVDGAFLRAAEPGVEDLPTPHATYTGVETDSFVQNRGRVVDIDGVRRLLPRKTGESSESLEQAIIDAHSASAREDLFVLRQLEPHTAEVKYLLGQLQADYNSSPVTKTGTRPAVFSKRGGPEETAQWIAFGSASAVRVQGGFAGDIFVETTVVTATGTVGECWIPGQRSSDSRIILLYTDGDAVRMCSFNETTGALVDGPVTLDTQTGTCKNIRAELDGLERLHVVYEHDEGSEQQVYYTRVSIAAASFGTADVTPRIVTSDTLTSTRDDTAPDIAVDRRGVAHIVFTSGIAPSAVGDLVYVVFDQNGTFVSRTLYAVASDVGRQASPLVHEGGFVADPSGSIRSCRVAVTPHDEVYAVCVDVTTNNELLLFSPTFEERLGFALVNVVFPDDFSMTGSIYAADIAADELGQLNIGWLSYDAGDHYRYETRLDTVYAPNGFVENSGGSVLSTKLAIAGSLTSSPQGLTTDEADIALSMGSLGDVVLAHRLNATDSGRVSTWGTLDERRPTPHPKDVWLSKILQPKTGTAAAPTDAGIIGLFNVRPKKMNHPFLVGRDGDYQGYQAIHQAVAAANIHGGEVVVRQGDHRASGIWGSPTTLHLRSGVSLKGEGKALLHGFGLLLGEPTGTHIGSVGGVLTSAFDYIWESTADPEDVLIREGDLVKTGSSFHRVLARLPPRDTYMTRLHLSLGKDGSTIPSGGVAIDLYPGGIRVENICIVDDRGVYITVQQSEQAQIRGVSFLGKATIGGGQGVILADAARNLLLEDIDFTGLDAASGNEAILIRNCYRPIIKTCTGLTTDIHEIYTDDTNDTPSIIGCSGVKVLPEALSRTTPVLVSGVGDADTSNLGVLQTLVTDVGQVIKAPLDSSLHFQDKNTRAASGAKNIQFSDAGANGDKLPAGRASILDAINTNRDDIDSNDTDIAQNVSDIAQNATDISTLDAREVAYNEALIKSGVLFGCTPTEGGGTTVDFTDGEVIVGGKQIAFGPQTNSTATTGSTTYYYYIDTAGDLIRAGAPPNMDAPNTCMLLIAETNAGNTGFDRFIDFRFCIGKNYQKGPLIVGPEGHDLDADETHFFSIYGAVEYLTLKDRNEVGEIIVTGECDLDAGKTATGVHIYVNFFGTNLGGIIIRGVGEKAGFVTTDSSVPAIWCNGLNSASDRDEKITVRLHNLLIKNTNAAGGTTVDGEPAFKFSNSFHDIVIDRCSVRAPNASLVNGMRAWQRILNTSSNFNVKNLTIADNYFETGEYNSIDLSNATLGVIESTYIFRNVFASAHGGGNSGYKVDCGNEVIDCWVTDNILTISDHAGSGSHSGLAVVVCRENAPASPTLANRAGMRFFANNQMNVIDQGMNYVFSISTGGHGGENAPVYILNNTFHGSMTRFIDMNCRQVGSIFAGNHVHNTGAGGDFFYKSDSTAALVGDEGYEAILNNYYKDSGTTTAAGGLYIRGGKLIIARNKFIGGWRTLNIDDDTGDGTEGDIYVIDNLFLESVNGGSSGNIVLCYRMDRLIFRGNVFKTTNASVGGVQIFQGGDSLFQNNIIQIEGGDHVLSFQSGDSICSGNYFRIVGATSGDHGTIVCSGANMVVVGNLVKVDSTDNISFLRAILELSGGCTAIGNQVIGGAGDRNGIIVGGAESIVIGNHVVLDATGSFANIRLNSGVVNSVIIGNIMENTEVSPNYWGDIRSTTTTDEFGTQNRGSTAIDNGMNQEV